MKAKIFENSTVRFIITQITHATITIIFLALLFTGAFKAGAFDQVMAIVTTDTGSNFTSINYQGRLADIGGNPVNNTSPGIGMTFALYDVDAGSSALWSETHANVSISEGLFSVKLGSVNALSTDMLGGDRWLEIQVGTDAPMTPREKLSAVPYAMQAASANYALQAENAANAIFADEAGGVPDDSITNAKLDLSGSLGLGSNASDAVWAGDYNNLIFQNTGGHIRGIAANSIFLFVDADNNTDDASFRVVHDNNHMEAPVETLLKIYETGGFYVKGGVQTGSVIENNLQTPAEMEEREIHRFSQGDVLCWDVTIQQLEKCNTQASPLIVAVADENGKPIVLGVEPVKVLGSVQPGDLLVASDIPGYAVEWSQIGEGNPLTGTVIAKVLEAFDGERGMVKAMIFGR